jgi:hypothetical protein
MIKYSLLFVILVTSAIEGPSAVVRAQQPALIPFQGQLTDQAGVPLTPTAPLTLTFRIYGTPVGGEVLWDESHPNMAVIAGRFSVLLGLRNALPGPSAFSKTLYLGITVDDGDPATADVEMRPRQAIVPVIYATNSGNAQMLNGHDWSDILVGHSNDPSTALISPEKVDLRVLIKRIETLEKNNPPVGTILAYAGPVDPAKLDTTMWRECNGDALPRADYQDLFKVIGTLWGKGNGSSTFNLPDLRGRFLRGLDIGGVLDKDKNRVVGSPQGDATKQPNTPFKTDDPGNHNHNNGEYDRLLKFDGHGTSAHPTDSASENRQPNIEWQGQIVSRGQHTHTITNGGDPETRPVNSAVIYIIRIK